MGHTVWIPFARASYNQPWPRIPGIRAVQPDVIEQALQCAIVHGVEGSILRRPKPNLKAHSSRYNQGRP